jgi:hypothetical protein
MDYSLSIPGLVLGHEQVVPQASTYEIVVDPQDLWQDSPNLDDAGRDSPGPGLADTISLGILLEGKRLAVSVNAANTLTIQDGEVFVGHDRVEWTHATYLPVVLKPWNQD